jgi:hypothetical protein
MLKKRFSDFMQAGIESKITLVIFLSFIIWRSLNLGLTLEPLSTLDTPGYISLSTLPLTDTQLWAGSRPFIYPLLIKLFAGNLVTLALFQFMLSIFAWGLLAYSFSRLFHHGILRLAALVVILTFSCASLIASWDLSIMTESLNFSLFALTFAFWFRFLKNQTALPLALLVGASSLWIFTRETNGWLAVMIGGAAVLAGLLGRKKYYLILATGIFAAFTVNYLLGGMNSDMNQRWIFPFLNVMAKRILKNEGRVDWFQAQGMPVSAELMKLTATDANGGNRAFYNSPALEPFRQWLIRDGRKAYMLFLLTNQQYFFLRPIQDLSYLSMGNNDENIPGQFRSLPLEINNAILINMDLPKLMQLGAIFAAMAVLFLLFKRNGLWLSLLLFILLVYPHLLIAWHGDSMGTSRHTLLANIELRLSIWMILLAALNEIWMIRGKFFHPGLVSE